MSFDSIGGKIDTFKMDEVRHFRVFEHECPFKVLNDSRTAYYHPFPTASLHYSFVRVLETPEPRECGSSRVDMRHETPAPTQSFYRREGVCRTLALCRRRPLNIRHHHHHRCRHHLLFLLHLPLCPFHCHAPWFRLLARSPPLPTSTHAAIRSSTHRRDRCSNLLPSRDRLDACYGIYCRHGDIAVAPSPFGVFTVRCALTYPFQREFF